MSIWRSPVFYFGVLLVLAVTAALAAPYVVPWNNYRSDLETYGRKLTGREVAIAGNIAVKLFPWPQLEAQDVAIGNPEGFSNDAFVKADAVRVTLSLAGLFNGTLNVESVYAEHPQVNLQRNASGHVNWVFAPQAQVAGQGLLSRVKLDQIVLSGGLISFDDLRNGHSTVFTDLDSTLSAQSILGPWRMQGQAKWNDVSFGLVVTTNEKQITEPLDFTVKLSPKDVSLPLASVEGAWDGTQFKGAVRLDPQETTGEKTSAEGAFKPLALQAALEVSTERMSLLKIRIAPSDRKDSGTLIEGDALVDFGTQAQARVNLKSPRINLDTLVGTAAIQKWRDGGFLKFTNQMMLSLPAKLTMDFSLDINVLTSGGQAMNDVKLTGGLQREAIRVTQFSAELPGRSVGVFDGVIFPRKDSAQLSGKFKFESGDSRAFVGWLLPDNRATLDKHWTGSRGRLEVQSGTMDWSEEHFGLANVLYSFDGSQGRASLSSQTGAEPDLNVTVDTGQIDIDSLVPDGWSLIRDGSLPSLISLVSQDMDAAPNSRRLILRAASVLLNGVTAQKVAIDIASKASGFEIKLLDIGNVSGARLRGGGSFVDKGNGPEGTLIFHLDAQDPRGFVQLVGLGNAPAGWTRALGVTSVEALLNAVPKKSGPELSMVLRGSTGPINAELVVSARELEKGRGAALAASGGVNTADSAALVRLFGANLTGAAGPADVTFEFNGSLVQNFAFSTSLKALNSIAKMEGTADVNQPYFGIAGKFSASAVDGEKVVNALGLPLNSAGHQPFNLAAIVAAKDGELSLFDLAAHVAGRRFAGQASFGTDHQFHADVETDTVNVRDAFALAFMPWEGTDFDSAKGFAAIDEQAIGGDVFIRPIQFDPMTGDALKEVVVGIGFESGKRQLTMSAPGEQGLKLDITMTPRGVSQDVTGTLRWPVDLARVVKTSDQLVLATGGLVVDGAFKTTGQSPAAALASMEGKGNFSLSQAAFSRLSLNGYANAVLAAKTPDALSLALGQLGSPPGTRFGEHIGSYVVSNGNAEFSAVSVSADGVKATITPQLDLTSGQMKIATTVLLSAQPALPPVTVTYSGPAGAFEVRNGTSALAAKLGYDLLSKEMAELEKLQNEQVALAAREEAQRKEDEQRFADYQSTRVELRMQAKLRKFQAGEREKRGLELQAIIDAAIKAGPALTRLELQRHGRQLEIRRILAAAAPQL